MFAPTEIEADGLQPRSRLWRPGLLFCAAPPQNAPDGALEKRSAIDTAAEHVTLGSAAVRNKRREKLEGDHARPTGVTKARRLCGNCDRFWFVGGIRNRNIDAAVRQRQTPIGEIPPEAADDRPDQPPATA